MLADKLKLTDDEIADLFAEALSKSKFDWVSLFDDTFNDLQRQANKSPRKAGADILEWPHS